jgi:hypothetical protein
MVGDENKPSMKGAAVWVPVSTDFSDVTKPSLPRIVVYYFDFSCSKEKLSISKGFTLFVVLNLFLSFKVKSSRVYFGTLSAMFV